MRTKPGPWGSSGKPKTDFEVWPDPEIRRGLLKDGGEAPPPSPPVPHLVKTFWVPRGWPDLKAAFPKIPLVCFHILRESVVWAEGWVWAGLSGPLQIPFLE